MGAVALLAASASAQIHGVQIGKSCQSPRCEGETTDCLIQVGHGDGFGDTVRILEAFDVIEPTGINVRVPAVGNLPIVLIDGNAVCSDSGGVCDQSSGVNCGFPCEVGPANSTLNGLPGDPNPGLLQFRQNQYVIQPADVSPLRDQATVNVMDLCDDPDTTGCSTLDNDVQFTAATTITRCKDEECQVEACNLGVCSSTSICETNPTRCDDENLCTTDACDDEVGGCCVNTPVVCDERACFNESCNPELGCVYTSVCTDPNFCDDENECTTDACDEEVDGCCVNTPVVCQERACFNESCDPAEGCVYTSVCTDPGFCDDDDDCTSDTCDVEADGCGVHPNICVCGDGNIDPGENCDGEDEASGVDCTNACDAACTCCGDDVRQSDEQCDGTQFEPGAPEGHGACRSDCTFCGDGTRQGDEQCDGTEFEDDAPPTHGSCRSDCTFCGDGTPNGGEACDDGNDVDTDTCRNDCTVPADFAGCTPGFWKQPHHLQYWPAPYLPTDRVDTVFSVTSTSNPTLLTALSTGGGGEIAFLRHAVSALLNSAHNEVDYLYTTAQVIAMVQQAYLTGDFDTPHGLFAAQNELGCTVDKSRGDASRLNSGSNKKR
jgi:cysteine-rich repeat protein